MKKTLPALVLLLLAVAFSLLIPFPVNAQTGTVRGFVYEKESGEPVIFTNVYFLKTSIGAATDVNGFFTITKIPPGDYTLMVTYLGFDTLVIPMTIRPSDMITRKFYLSASSVNLNEINVSATRQEKKTETQTSIIKITPREIQQIPTIGGQPDLAQYLQILPGVIFTGDQGGQLYIRGGPPIQNKVILDGMTIYNPFHSIGLFSVFDVDILKNVEVYTGGFNAEYGGRISSVMDVTTRDGNKKRFSGKLDASTFGAKILLEGPIVKQKTDSSTSVSFILSVKNSYLEQSSKIFYTYIDENGLPYNYLDIYGKISVNAPNWSKVSFFGFNFSDNVQYKVLQNYGWDSYGGGLNFVVIPGKAPILLEGYVDYSSYKVTLDELNKTARSSSISGFNAGLNFTYFFGKDALRYGIELNGFKTVLDFYNSIGRKIDYTQNTTELCGFVKYKWIGGRFIVEPGLRIQYYASLSEFSPEPRLAVKFNAAEHFRLKMAAGYYTQNLISTTYDRDVVNLFYGFLASPENLPKFKGKEVKSKLQKSYQVVLGFELDFLRYLSLNIEGYYKYYPQLTTLNLNKLYDDAPPYDDPNSENYQPDYLRKDFIIEQGDAEGVDVSLRFDRNRLHFWLVYSLCFIHRTDGLSTYVPPYDRRHNINLTSTYIFGKKQGWELNALYNYGSGFPFTQTQGFYEAIGFSDIFDDYLTENGSLGIIYGDFDEGRLPYYSRLDLSLTKHLILGKRARMDINLSVTNVLNQQNIFYFDRITYTRIDQLPIMPSLGISFSF